MSTLHRAVVRAYASGTHKADVQLVESLPTHLTAVPVATDIPVAEVVAGRECAVLLFDDNPDNGVVVTIHGAVPAAAAGGDEITDADGDTYVRVEQSADEDKVRMAAGGTLRYLIQTASPHHQLTGDVQITGGLGAGGIAPNASVAAWLGWQSGSVNQKTGLVVDMGASTGAPTAGNVIGVAGRAVSNDASITAAFGLDYLAGMTSQTLTAAYGCRTQLLASGAGKTVTDYFGFYAANGTNVFSTVTRWTGFYVPSLTIGTSRYPFYDAGTTDSGNTKGNVFKSNTQLFQTTLDFGGGQGVLGIGLAATAPTTNPTGGVVVYVDPADNKLKCRGSAGTVTVLANP